MVAVDIEVEAGAARILADKAGRVGFSDRFLQRFALVDIFAAQVDVALAGAHREGSNQAAFDQQVRIVAHDVPVLACAGFGFVGVDDEIVRALLHHLGHEGPFEPRREASAAAPAQARGLDLVADPFGAELHQLLRGVPCAAFLRGLQTPVLATVEIGEDTIFIEKHGRAPPCLHG